MSCRFPPGLNRCRTVRPEEAGSGAAPWRRRGVAVGVATDVDDLGDEPVRDQRPGAVQVGQGGVGGGDQPGDLPFQFRCLGVDGDDAFEAAPAQAARTLPSSPSSSSAARTRARVVRVGMCCW